MVGKKEKKEDHPGLLISKHFAKKYPLTSKIVHLEPINDDELWKFLKETDERVKRAGHVKLFIS